MVGANVSDRFCTMSGVGQGCVLAPALFCRAIDSIVDNMTCLRSIAVGNGNFTDLDYADDIVLPANTHAELAPCLTDFSMSARSMGLTSPGKRQKSNASVVLFRRPTCTYRTRLLSQWIVSATWVVCRTQAE